MRQGDIIEVIDGRGNKYSCRITTANQHKTELEIIHAEPVALAWSYNITVAVAPTKNIDRMEWLVEKLTEIGINRFTPLLCRHSERKEIKVDRLERIAISAMKQSLKATLPIIDAMTPIDEFICKPNNSNKFIAYCDASIPRLLLAKEVIPQTDVSILIGPEGDFDSNEIHSALDTGFKPITLGDNRLRTETAALVAVDTIHIINQHNE
jgi:16S rRNA (uracil1498-N3)-methyltransferase